MNDRLLLGLAPSGQRSSEGVTIILKFQYKIWQRTLWSSVADDETLTLPYINDRSHHHEMQLVLGEPLAPRRG